MRRLFLSISVAACAQVSCGSPAAPGLPPQASIPPSPAANDCAPTRQLAGTWFHFADLMGGNSCPVYVEQDECVLGIFSDCTDRAVHRQWLGRVSAEGQLSLTAQRENSPAGPTCSGTLDSGTGELTRLELGCAVGGPNPSSEIVLEQRLDPAPEFGAVERRVDVYPFTTAIFANYDHYMFDLCHVQLADRWELWFTVDDDVGVESGLYVLDPVLKQRVAIVPMPAARLIQSTGSTVVAASQHAVMKVDANLRSATGVADLGGMLETSALAILESADRVIVSVNPDNVGRHATTTAFRLSDLSLVTEADEIGISWVKTIAEVPGQPDGTVAFLFGVAFQTGRGIAKGVTADLEITRTHELPFELASARYLPTRGVIGGVSGNRYVELDPTDPQAPLRRVIGVPYTENALDFSFDPETARVYFLGRSFLPTFPMLSYHLRPSLLTYLDLENERAVQEMIEIQALTRRVMFLEQAGAVIVPLQRLGRVEWVRL